MGNEKPVVIIDQVTDVALTINSDGSVSVSHNKTLASAAVNATNAGDNELVAAASGLKTKVYAWMVTGEFAAPQVLKFEDAAGGTTLAHLWMRSDAMGAKQNVSPPAFLFETTANTALSMENAGGADTYVNLSYFQEA